MFTPGVRLRDVEEQVSVGLCPNIGANLAVAQGMESAGPFPGSIQTTSYEDNCLVKSGFGFHAWTVCGHAARIAAIQHEIESFHSVLDLIMIASSLLISKPNSSLCSATHVKRNRKRATATG
jgi:hypothetical protein